jgi:hypothetical protein
VHEGFEILPFLAPPDWLHDTCAAALKQAYLKKIESPRVSRGGKHDLTKALRAQDVSYGILYVTFNTDTPLRLADARLQDLLAEQLCVRIAFVALKDLKPGEDFERFLAFDSTSKVDREWVENWLGTSKCIPLIDELNLLQSSMDEKFATFLKETFLLLSRGFTKQRPPHVHVFSK